MCMEEFQTHEFLMAGLSISSDNVVRIAEVWVFKNTIWYTMFTVIYIYMSRDETYSLQTSLDIGEQVLTYVLFGRLNIQVKGMKWTNLTALLAKVLVCFSVCSLPIVTALSQEIVQYTINTRFPPVKQIL